MTDLERRLFGGNVADGVVRVGATVRKPATSSTNTVEAFLKHLNDVGFTGAPRTMGRDEQGRHMLEYVPGVTIDHPDQLSKDELWRVGQLVREFHNAARSFTPPAWGCWNVAIKPNSIGQGSESMFCHHDLAPWNLVRDGERWVFIDWDGSGPGTALWDLAYAAQSFVPLGPEGDPVLDAERLCWFVSGYGLSRSEREALPRLIVERTRAMHHLLEDGARTGEQPWARLHAEGHAVHWGRSAAYIEQHLDMWKNALLGDCEE